MLNLITLVQALFYVIKELPNVLVGHPLGHPHGLNLCNAKVEVMYVINAVFTVHFGQSFVLKTNVGIGLLVNFY